MGMLSQSRGSMIAGAAALAVYVAFSRDRARRLAWLVLAALPALIVLPPLTDLYREANNGTPIHALGGELRSAADAAALSALVALVIGAAAALLERRLPISDRGGRIADRAALAGVVVALIGGSIAFVAIVGDPVHWVSEKASQFQAGEATQPIGKSSRFTFNARTGRGELWRVALVDFGDHPLIGDGGGGYRYTYLTERHPDAPVAVNDAHSVELENLSELGIVGFALLVAAVAAAATGAIRARRRGPDAAWLSAIALTAGTYWLFHSSLDWFWPYPAVTAPVFALLGSACAPCLRRRQAPSVDAERQPGRGRLAVAIGAIVLAVSVVPPFLSERYTSDAYAVWRVDASRAYSDLDRARSLNPLSVDPVLAEGAIARANGDRARAIAAFQDAVAKRPEEWVSYYLLAVLHERSSPGLARREAAAARDRDPSTPRSRPFRPSCGRAATERPSAQVDHPALEGQGDRLCAGACAELCLRVSNVGLDGGGRELEESGDLLVRRAGGEKGQDLALARGGAATGEARNVVGRRPCGSAPAPSGSSIWAPPPERIRRWRPGRTLAVTVMCTSSVAAACELSSKGPAWPPPSRKARHTWSTRERIPAARKSSKVRPITARRGSPSSRHAARLASRHLRSSSTTMIASCAGTPPIAAAPLGPTPLLVTGLADKEPLSRRPQRPMSVAARLEAGLDDDQPVGEHRAALDVEKVVAELPGGADSEPA